MEYLKVTENHDLVVGIANLLRQNIELNQSTRQFLISHLEEIAVDPDDIFDVLKDIPFGSELFKQNKIMFIKWIRGKTGLGLQDSKALAERIINYQLERE